MTYRHPKIGIPVTGDKVIEKPHTCEWCRWANHDLFGNDSTDVACNKDELSEYGSDSEYIFSPAKDFGCIFWAGADDQKGA